MHSGSLRFSTNLHGIRSSFCVVVKTYRRSPFSRSIPKELSYTEQNEVFYYPGYCAFIFCIR